MKRASEIGFLKKLILKFLTKLQELHLKNGKANKYLRVTKLHFKLYFGKDLVEEAVLNSEEFKLAKKRHMAMSVVNSFNGNAAKWKKQMGETFHSNLLLEANLCEK